MSGAFYLCWFALLCLVVTVVPGKAEALLARVAVKYACAQGLQDDLASLGEAVRTQVVLRFGAVYRRLLLVHEGAAGRLVKLVTACQILPTVLAFQFGVDLCQLLLKLRYCLLALQSEALNREQAVKEVADCCLDLRIGANVQKAFREWQHLAGGCDKGEQGGGFGHGGDAVTTLNLAQAAVGSEVVA